MSGNFPIGISKLLELTKKPHETYVGKVTKNDDDLGRIKCNIPELFEGLSVNDTPWIQMAPSTGAYIKPEIGEYVTIEFRGSIYEGFYISNSVNSTDVNKILSGSDLNKSFVINLHESVIKGKYDGSQLIIETPNFKIENEDNKVKIELGLNNKPGDMEILTSQGNIKITAGGMMPLGGTVILDGLAQGIKIGGALAIMSCNDLPSCLISGAPHAIGTAIPGMTSVKVP